MKRFSLFESIIVKKPLRRASATIIAAALSAAMLVGCTTSASTARAAEKNAYTVKDVQVFDGEPTDQRVTLRFYEEAPHVAYMGIGAYYDLMMGGGLTIKDNGDGTFTMTNRAGAEAVADIGKGLVTIKDLPAFENYTEAAMAGIQSSFKDSPAPYLRLREVVYEGEPQPVAFDLGGLGIKIYGDKEDVWFPVSILSSWLTDIAQNNVMYNGKYLYKSDGEDQYTQDEAYFDTEYMDRVLQGGEREKDLASYSYAELGFIFRYMYGYPVRTDLDSKVLREQGLDAALKKLGDQGKELAEELSSTDMRQFWHGMFSLSGTVLEDGHNNTCLDFQIPESDDADRYESFRDYTWDIYAEDGITAFEQKMMQANMGIFQARPSEFTENPYHSNGDTAMILLRGFTVDKEAWEAYYYEDGPMPSDTYGTLAQGLEKAAADDKIKNVVIDLSTNGGGYTDAAAACISLMTGRDYLCGYNALSKQYFKVYFDIDRNLDGKIDDKDKEVRYDFHYGALVSNASFSCGNMFPYLIKDEGGVVIGERSSGGSCSVQKAALSEGFSFMISGYKFKLTDSRHSDLELGIEPDIPLAIPLVNGIDEITGEEGETKDYTAYGDLEQICGAMREWFR